MEVQELTTGVQEMTADEGVDSGSVSYDGKSDIVYGGSVEDIGGSMRVDG